MLRPTKSPPLSAAVMASVLALFLTACGSSSDASSSEDIVADEQGLDAAQEIVDKWTQSPTEIGYTEALESLPGGETVYYMQCLAPVCQSWTTAMEEAGQLLGLEVFNVNVGGTADSTAKGWDKAANDKPGAVVFPSQPYETVKRQADELKEAGVPMICFACVDWPEGYLEANFVQDEDAQDVADMQAAWPVVQVEGKGKFAYFVVQSIPDQKLHEELTAKALKTFCPECGYEAVSVPYEDLGRKLPSTVVSYLQRNPDTNYLIFGFGDMLIGVPAALEAAGLDPTDYPAVSFVGQEFNLNLIKDGGQQTADVQQPNEMLGWMAMDAAARAVTGQGQPDPRPILPTILATKDNLTWDPSSPWPGPDGWEEAFQTLWGL